MTPAILATLMGLSALLSFALYVRNAVQHIGGPVQVIFGAWATIGALAFIAAVIVGVAQ